LGEGGSLITTGLLKAVGRISEKYRVDLLGDGEQGCSARAEVYVFFCGNETKFINQGQDFLYVPI
jgi:hypothetical protein